ncbi:MAG: 1-deoxy-D-xylulose-5-phosphate synthase, partial [Lachnospiraceae bacterium]|nr:1-deoxy-D-xylulose-5-phosphate synthase [Lachnospiraceae bacterium]
GVQSALEKIPLIGEALVSGIRKVKNGIKQLLIPGMIFEDLGIMYIGPVRGHNIEDMERAFHRAREFQGPVLVHVITEKGRGFAPAQRHPSRFHGADPFDKERGLPLVSKKPSYTDIFSTVMRKMGDRNPNVVAVTAAMMDGTGLKRFHNMFPDRFFDVGIAEEHAVTFAAGMATRGIIPVVAIYSSFLQRAYDQLLHDVALQKLHVVFAVDRAGLVGSDGATHQGVFDLSYLTTIPDMVVMAPKNKYELSDMMKWAVAYGEGPVAIRYPRGEACVNYRDERAPIRLGRSEPMKSGGRILLYAIGSMVDEAMKAKKLLSADDIKVAVCNARFAAPLDEAYLKEAADRYDMIVTMEENVRSGGFGEHVTDCLMALGYRGRVEIISVPDEFVEHGNVALLKKNLGIDAESVAERIKKWQKTKR